MKSLFHTFMAQPLIKKISDITFIASVTISAITLFRTYLSQRDLPPGVCPISNYNDWYILSIALLLLSFGLSFFDKKKSS